MLYGAQRGLTSLTVSLTGAARRQTVGLTIRPV